MWPLRTSACNFSESSALKKLFYVAYPLLSSDKTKVRISIIVFSQPLQSEKGKTLRLRRRLFASFAELALRSLRETFLRVCQTLQI